MIFYYKRAIHHCMSKKSLAILSLFMFLLINTRAQKKTSSGIYMKNVELGFNKIPDSIRTSVYWYWVSDNISNQGVINDLEAMKKVGINRAFIANIGMSDIPYGKIKLFSAEWWEILHTALKTAARLDIEIGLFNSPGWTQSGGPWVKSKQSMRYLTSSEIRVHGPVNIHTKLMRPNADFQDVKVIAYPAPEYSRSENTGLQFKLIASTPIPDLNNLIDGDYKTLINLPKGDAFSINFSALQPYTVRSISFYPGQLTTRTFLTGDLQVKIKNKYTTIRNFTVNRTTHDLNSGFKPYSPVALSIPPTTSTDFRIVFHEVLPKSSLAEIKLSSAPVLENYIEKSLAKMWQNPYVNWLAYQWNKQPDPEERGSAIDPAKVIDISGHMSADGTLNWQVPAGEWIIERTGMTSTMVQNGPASPEGLGLETDKMSRTHIQSHFDAFIGEILKRIPAKDRRTWKVVVQDSYEAGSQNWTDNLVTNFKAVYGYDPIPYIPVMRGRIVGSPDRSDRFLWDLRRFIADQLAYEYVRALRQISHQHGLTTWLENYGHSGFPGEFLQYGGQSDEVAGEFWTDGNLGALENRAAASCAHIYGKNKVSSESFTCGGPSFSRYPAMLKQRADRYFTEGINNTLLHVYIQQPSEDKVPGINAWFGNEFNRHNTWFYDMDLFLKYIKRCNFLLQQGRYVADVAYFISEDTPKMTGPTEPLLPAGYSFDYINAEVILTRATVKNGKLFLPDGMSYSILVLPNQETMRPQFLRKLKALVAQGLVVLGQRPSRSPSLQDYGQADQEVQRLAAELWADSKSLVPSVHQFGKGKVIEGMSLLEALKLIKVKPDCITPAADSLLYIHRELKDGSVYFLSNQKNKSVQFQAQFRSAGKTPELWDPVSGRTRDLPDYMVTDSNTTVPLALAPAESVFIVFRKKHTRTVVKQSNYPKVLRSIAIKNNWLVKFDPKMRGPSRPVIFTKLEDWTFNKMDSIRYYSGTALYHNSFAMPALKNQEKVILDLGIVRAIAKVKVNGIDLGGVWTYPYHLDITSALRSGTNILEIKVVNTWVNRLIGDSRLPQNERETSAAYNIYKPDDALSPSGLLAPVQLHIFNH
jgi:hypothetical protein